MTGWIIVFSGDQDAASAALEALGGAGIEAVSAPAQNRLAATFNLAPAWEVAVPRRQALEAAHVLRSDRLGFGEPEQRGRSRRFLLAVVAAVLILAMVLLAALVLLPSAGR